MTDYQNTKERDNDKDCGDSKSADTHTSFKFYAFLNRMKYINRWSLMRNSRNENVAEHSHQTALIAHALACIEKVIFKRDVSPEKAAVYALYHEVAEVITGDLPTPIKYFNNDIRAAYKHVESIAEDKLLSSLPGGLFKEISACVKPLDCYEKKLVKYADKLAALIKCIEEKSTNNGEFNEAYDSTLKDLQSYNSDSVNYFIKNFIDAYYLSLDKLSI